MTSSISQSLVLPSHMRGPASLPFRSRVQAAEAATNPLFEAARPLLQALADTPADLDGNSIAQRRKWLEHEVRVFEQVCAQLQIRPDHVQSARYCLCSALDEAAMQTDWGKGVTTGVEWSQNGLAVAFGEDRQGGDGVYRVIRQVMRHPQENLDLIEVIQNILDLGFKGRYRFEARGQDTLEAIREQVHDAVVTSGWSVPSPSVQRARVASPAPLPRWPVDPWVRPAPTRNTRLWIAIGLLSVALLGACAYVVHERLTRESRLQQLTPPMDVLARNLDSLLKSEIAAGSVSLEGNVAHTALTLRFNDMFPPGQATVNAWVGPLIATAGREIAKAPGRVRVTGYTDSLPVSKSQSASNKTLSEDRATQVMQILSAAGVPAERLETAGKGKADPIAGNETPQGRARNRRVEIMVSE